MNASSFKTEIDVKVFGSYDVIVCGAGTAGVVAALASARNGAKTLLLESDYYLGGMMTMGNAGLTKFVKHGIDPEEQYKIDEELKTTPENVQVVGGIPLEMVNTLIKDGYAVGTHGTAASYVYTDSHNFKIYLFEELYKAGVKILLHSKVIKVLKEEQKITGVLFDTKEGVMVAYAKYVIDATGDGDVAALAGVAHRVGAAETDSAVQDGQISVGELDHVGSMFRIGGVDYEKFIQFIKDNPQRFKVQRIGLMEEDYFLSEYEKGDSIVTFMEPDEGWWFQVYNYPYAGVMVGCVVTVETDNLNCLLAEDLTQAEYEVLKSANEYLQTAKRSFAGFENAYIMDVPKAGVRETRHIEGEYSLTIVDVLSDKDFYDCIGFSSHPIDISPRPKECDDIPLAKRASFQIPYRCLVAKDVDNLFISGRHVSATREASGCTRVTACCMVTGEAAGTAAALLSKSGGKAKDIDIENLRAVLKANGVKC